MENKEKHNLEDTGWSKILMMCLDAQLRTDEMELIMWHYWCGLTFDEISKFLEYSKCSKQYIEQRHAKILKWMKKSINEDN